jgi:pimeloyl-ACP methyl ester carboxylesterase
MIGAAINNVAMGSIGRLRYVEAPASPPAGASRPQGTLVLIHAFPLNARMWEPQLALADQGWRVIAPHLRGFDGGTGETARSVDDYAGDVIDLLDALHIPEAVIGGLSLGGYVTFAMFRHAPRYFRGMVLADTRSQADTPEGVQGRHTMLALLRDKGPGAIADEMIPKLLGETTRGEQPGVAERTRSLILASSTEAIAGAVSALMTRPDSTPLLGSIHCPTLILVGDEDKLTPPALSHEMHDAITGSELVTIPRAGHLSSLEQPVAFNAAVARFLSLRV